MCVLCSLGVKRASDVLCYHHSQPDSSETVSHWIWNKQVPAIQPDSLHPAPTPLGYRKACLF